MLNVRPAEATDSDQIWSILEPIIRAGEAYSLPRDLPREESLSFWFGKGYRVFVAEEHKHVVGTYFLRANQVGGGAHVANCGYATSANFTGKGVARAMCAHSLALASSLGFRAMQFNFVVSTNERAVRLWKGMGFEIVGTLPESFLHPSLGYVDVYVMYQALTPKGSSK